MPCSPKPPPPPNKACHAQRTGDSLQYAFIIFENPRDCEQARGCCCCLRILPCALEPTLCPSLTASFCEIDVAVLCMFCAEAYFKMHDCVIDDRPRVLRGFGRIWRTPKDPARLLQGLFWGCCKGPQCFQRRVIIVIIIMIVIITGSVPSQACIFFSSSPPSSTASPHIMHIIIIIMITTVVTT